MVIIVKKWRNACTHRLSRKRGRDTYQKGPDLKGPNVQLLPCIDRGECRSEETLLSTWSKLSRHDSSYSFSHAATPAQCQCPGIRLARADQGSCSVMMLNLFNCQSVQRSISKALEVCSMTACGYSAGWWVCWVFGYHITQRNLTTVGAYARRHFPLITT